MYVVAWRGESNKCLENTAEAVEATPSWVPLIEIDTRLTSDGKMVAYHSPTMRVHGDSREVADISWDELSKKCILYRKREYRIPLVADLLSSFPGRSFLLHVKREADISRYLDEVLRFPRASFFHSNSDRHLAALAGNSKSLGLFKSIYKPPEPREVLSFVHGYMLGHRAFVSEYSALEVEWLLALRSAKKHLLVFAGSTERWIREVVGYDVDGFLTNRFDRALSVLGSELNYAMDDISLEFELHLPIGDV